MRTPFTLLVLLTPLLGLRAADGFAKYQPILDRLPFGKPMEKVNLTPPPAAPEPVYAWINDYRMVFITQTVDNKAKIGLVNVKDQTTMSLEVGDTHPSGIQLLAVNYDERSASLGKGGQVQPIKLQDPATAQPAAAPGQPGAGNPRVPPSLTSGRGGPAFARPPRPNTPPAAPAAPTAEPPKRLTGEELEKHLQEYQVEVLRKGLPPLPVQLTPENDAKLVNEGVLPALDANGAAAAPAAPAGP